MLVETAMPAASISAVSTTGSLGANGSRRALAGFYLSGILMGFLGAILLAWEHHLSTDYASVSWYCIALIAGLALAVPFASRLLESRGVSWTLALASILAGLAFLYLAFASPPTSAPWRLPGLVGIGFAVGLLHTAVFHALAPIYRHDPIGTLNLAGVLFGLGCLTDAVLVSGTYFFYDAPAFQAWMAILPVALGWMFWRAPQPAPTPVQPPNGAFLHTLRSPSAILLTLLILVHTGNEWAVASWLALFLCQRLGLSPSTALWMLGLYWTALTVGRVVAQWMLPRVRHSILILSCVLLSLFASIILSFTDNAFGAISAIFMLGGAFAPIYPLIVSKVGSSAPNYHPAFYNGLFTVALAGGFLAPALLGWLVQFWGLGAVMTMAMFGSIVVALLLGLLWIGVRLGLYAPRVNP
jgi:MFS transporter, FHS family, glucose/mannose:H+ symporter